MNGVFIIGVDTGVGKTIISAGVMLMLAGTRKLLYWKPVQTGTIVGDDTTEVQSLTGLNASYFMEPMYRFPDPISPHVAARKWGKQIDLNEMHRQFEAKTKDGTFVVVEGAGGLLVPYNDTQLQIDFITMTKLPVLIVTQDRVGAINQSLLTIRAAREAGIEIVGFVLTRSRGQFGNAESISGFGQVEILAEFPPMDDRRSLVAQVGGHNRIRKYFNVPVLPK